MKLTPDGIISYGGAFASVASGLTLQDYGVIVGIITALATCATHIYVSTKRVRLESDVANARIAEAKSHTVPDEA